MTNRNELNRMNRAKNLYNAKKYKKKRTQTDNVDVNSVVTQTDFEFENAESSEAKRYFHKVIYY